MRRLTTAFTQTSDVQRPSRGPAPSLRGVATFAKIQPLAPRLALASVGDRRLQSDTHRRVTRRQKTSKLSSGADDIKAPSKNIKAGLDKTLLAADWRLFCRLRGLLQQCRRGDAEGQINSMT